MLPFHVQSDTSVRCVAGIGRFYSIVPPRLVGDHENTCTHTHTPHTHTRPRKCLASCGAKSQQLGVKDSRPTHLTRFALLAVTATQRHIVLFARSCLCPLKDAPGNSRVAELLCFFFALCLPHSFRKRAHITSSQGRYAFERLHRPLPQMWEVLTSGIAHACTIWRCLCGPAAAASNAMGRLCTRQAEQQQPAAPPPMMLQPPLQR